MKGKFSVSLAAETLIRVKRSKITTCPVQVSIVEKKGVVDTARRKCAQVSKRINFNVKFKPPSKSEPASETNLRSRKRTFAALHYSDLRNPDPLKIDTDHSHHPYSQRRPLRLPLFKKSKTGEVMD